VKIRGILNIHQYLAELTSKFVPLIRQNISVKRSQLPEKFFSIFQNFAY